MCVDYLPYSETSFPLTKATREGVRQIKAFNPYKWHSGAEMFTCADVWYEKKPESGMFVKSQEAGAWIYVKGVDFGKGSDKMTLWVKGKGCLEIRSDKSDTTPLATVGFSENDTSEISVRLLEKVSGIHNLYFVFSAKDIYLEAWRAERKEQV